MEKPDTMPGCSATGVGSGPGPREIRQEGEITIDGLSPDLSLRPVTCARVTVGKVTKTGTTKTGENRSNRESPNRP
jgi:hypothetical protein